MNYDTVIVELLSRVQALEEQVKELKTSQQSKTKNNLSNIMDTTSKTTTRDIKEYILELKQKARIEGKASITLVARDINNDLQLKKRYPMVCNAMRQCMDISDEIVFSPSSGYSSTLEIKYYL